MDSKVNLTLDILNRDAAGKGEALCDVCSGTGESLGGVVIYDTNTPSLVCQKCWESSQDSKSKLVQAAKLAGIALDRSRPYEQLDKSKSFNYNAVRWRQNSRNLFSASAFDLEHFKFLGEDAWKTKKAEMIAKCLTDAIAGRCMVTSFFPSDF